MSQAELNGELFTLERFPPNAEEEALQAWEAADEYLLQQVNDVDGLTLVLLSFGIASFIGTSLSSVLLKRSVKAALAIAPLVLTACAVALVLWGESKIIASTVAIIWGFAVALIPEGW